MPLRNDLLNPISADRPAGENLWYSPTYDKIKEARREDDDAPQGDWRRERKTADWQATIKLISEALATKTKDLQLAAWLSEAMLRREGLESFHATLNLIRSLIETYWEGLYPELEDGDAEFRASPLRWLGEKNDRLELALRNIPLTKGGYGQVKIEESRTVPTEIEAGESYEKAAKREEALAEGKIAREVVDKDIETTPKKFYVDLCAEFDGTLESLEQLGQVCDDKFADASPSFNRLKTVLEEVRQMARNMLRDKREKDPDEPAPAAVAEPQAEPEAEAAPEVVETFAAAPVRKKTRVLGAEPSDYEDAVARVAVVARFMRAQDPVNPTPYLLLRGLRWGELRADGTSIDQMKLAAPPTEIRQGLKRASMEGNWAEVLETAETAMALECGRGWLDLQRYAARACAELGYLYEPIRLALIAELKCLLQDYPQLPEFTLLDDTPTANAETVAWLKEQVVPPVAEPEPVAVAAAPEPVYQYYEPPPPMMDNGQAPAAAEPDAFDLAMQAAQAGRPQEGIELLMREMMQEPSGRGRFQRKIQVAQLCLGMGNEAIALPILQEAAAEIERRKLEEWEARETVAHPLSMLYRCLVKKNEAADERQRLYSWLCRLDPIEAMKASK